MVEIKYEIKKGLGSIGQTSKGWTKEVNLVSWNGRKAKLDIRDWDETHKKMGKGVTLSKEEVLALKGILGKINLDELDIE